MESVNYFMEDVSQLLQNKFERNVTIINGEKGFKITIPQKDDNEMFYLDDLIEPMDSLLIPWINVKWEEIDYIATHSRIGLIVEFTV